MDRGSFWVWHSILVMMPNFNNLFVKVFTYFDERIRDINVQRYSRVENIKG